MHSMFSSTSFLSGDCGGTLAKSSLRVFVPLNCPLAAAHLSKNGVMSVTRSFTTGRLCRGPISSMSPSATTETCVRHVQRALPLTVIAHEPHMPTRHAKRYDRVGSHLRWMCVTTSSTVWLSRRGTVNSSKCPDSFPRHTRTRSVLIGSPGDEVRNAKCEARNKTAGAARFYSSLITSH